MKIAYAQMKIAAGQLDRNTEKILQLIDAAKAGGADVVIFPELAASGLLIGEMWEQDSFLKEYEFCTDKIIRASKGIIVIFGTVFVDDFWTFNAVYVAKNGELTQPPVRRKIVTPKEESTMYSRESPDKIVFEFDGTTYCVGLIFFGESVSNADFCIKYSSDPFRLGKKIPGERTHRPIIRVGGVGIQGYDKMIYPFDGGSAVLNSRGEIVQLAEPFAECLNFVDYEAIDNMPVLEVPETPETVEIYRTLHFGVKTFLEQIGMNKVVIGVSGGIDSAVAAALYVQIVGAENVILVNMPSKFNSATTKNLSEQLAKNLGCQYYVVPIQESVDWTVKQLEERGIEVSDFVKENIQARDRGSRILAAIAASVGGVFTCNANKAETTVGYATLYGDAAGFMSALADLWKYQVYDLARYLNSEIYKREVIPQGIIDIVPSAELSTAQNVDEGKGDPLKYPYHDYLFRAFVDRNLTPEEILYFYSYGLLEKNIGCEEGLVKKYFPTAREFIADLERWWKAFTGMGIAKRFQAPPILAITNKPFGARFESQNGVYFTRGYRKLKEKLLA